jgi:hypothetical protein
MRDVPLKKLKFINYKPLSRFAGSPLKGEKTLLYFGVFLPPLGGVPEGRGGKIEKAES